MTDKDRFIRQLEAAYKRAKTGPKWRVKEALGDKYTEQAWIDLQNQK